MIKDSDLLTPEIIEKCSTVSDDNLTSDAMILTPAGTYIIKSKYATKLPAITVGDLKERYIELTGHKLIINL